MSLGLTDELNKSVSAESYDVAAETPDLLTSLFNYVAPAQSVDLSTKATQPDVFVGQNPKDVASLQKTLANPGIKVVTAPAAEKVAKGIDQTRSNVNQNVTNAKEAMTSAVQQAQEMDRKNESMTQPTRNNNGASPLRAVIASTIPDPVSACLTLAAGAIGGPGAATACAALTTGVQVACAAIKGSGSQATFANACSDTPKYGSKAEMKKMARSGYGISESAPSPQPYGQQTFAQSKQATPAVASIDSGRIQTTEDGLSSITRCVLNSPQMACLRANMDYYGDMQKQLIKREQDGVPLTKDNVGSLASMGADQQINNIINNNASRLTGLV